MGIGLRLHWFGIVEGYVKRFKKVLIAAALTVLLLPITGFLPRNYSDSDDPQKLLVNVGRWSNRSGSLVENKVYGLGGGLEYALAPDFCDVMLPKIVDTPKPTCEQLKALIYETVNLWGAQNPAIRFVDVSEKITASREVTKGAEIDLFAKTPTEDLGLVSNVAYAVNRGIYRTPPMGTSGNLLPGVTITNEDVVFNASLCFFIDPINVGRGCWHFQTTLLHEVGHTLGLTHPNEGVHRNFDTDYDGANMIDIDCEDPSKGLMISTIVDGLNVMNTPRSNGYVLFKLTNDDLGGLNFLYPVCPGQYLAVQAAAGIAEQMATVRDQLVAVWFYDAAAKSWRIYVAGMPSVSTLPVLQQNTLAVVVLRESAVLNYGGYTYRLSRGVNRISWDIP